MDKRKGFTIIEVVLVLAIAGLIFLMVFIALPALQRSQRDAQRKNDIAQIVDAYNRCLSNAKGRYCDVWTLLTSSYLKMDEWKDPSTGERYLARGVSDPGSAPGVNVYSDPADWELGVVYWNNGGRCLDGKPDNGVYRARAFVAATKLESGGAVCISNFNE